jgi:hypothetical protein
LNTVKSVSNVHDYLNELWFCYSHFIYS